jgi:cytochrome P450
MTQDLANEFERCVAYGQNPYPFYGRVRTQQPVFYSKRFNMWFVARYSEIVDILRDPAIFSSEGRSIKPDSWPDSVAEVMARRRHAIHVGNTDPPKHTRLRQALSQTFAPGNIERLQPLIRDTADRLAANLSQPPVDLLEHFCYPFPLMVILSIIGIPMTDLKQCMHWCRRKSALDFASETLTVAEQLETAQASIAFIDYCDNLVRQRRTHPSDDLISKLLHADAGGHQPLTVTEVSDLLPLLIFAGHETTANLIANLLWHLLSTSHIDAVRANPLLLEAAVEECLRYDSPALGFVRRATREVEVAGTLIPAGAKLFLLFGSANHDEARWCNPDRFHIRRPKASSHLAFGHGIHYCIGAPLARLETRVGLESLLTALPTLRLADPAAEPERRVHLVLRTLKRLSVTW